MGLMFVWVFVAESVGDERGGFEGRFVTRSSSDFRSDVATAVAKPALSLVLTTSPTFAVMQACFLPEPRRDLHVVLMSSC